MCSWAGVMLSCACQFGEGASVLAGDCCQSQPIGTGGRDTVALLPAETRESAAEFVSGCDITVPKNTDTPTCTEMHIHMQTDTLIQTHACRHTGARNHTPSPLPPGKAGPKRLAPAARARRAPSPPPCPPSPWTPWWPPTRPSSSTSSRPSARSTPARPRAAGKGAGQGGRRALYTRSLAGPPLQAVFSMDVDPRGRGMLIEVAGVFLCIYLSR